MADLEQLRDDLGQLRKLLLASRPAYAEREAGLARIQAGLVSSATRDAAVRELLDSREYFGGMGSLNDLIFCEANENIPAGHSEHDANALLDLLLDRIFRGASLYGSSAGDRAQWLERESASRVPPRIARTFR